MVNPRMTLTVQLVLWALLAEPGREMYGTEIMRAAGLPSGTIYPILARLEDAGWTTARDEDIDPHAEKRPPRRYYRLTGDGAAAAREAMSRAATQLAALGIADVPVAVQAVPSRPAREKVPAPPESDGVPAVKFSEPEPVPVAVKTPPVVVPSLRRASDLPVPPRCQHPGTRRIGGWCVPCQADVQPGGKLPADWVMPEGWSAS